MARQYAAVGGWGVVALVLLRVALGWHFYTEGVKKLDGKFSAAGFLSTAEGPLAEFYHSFVPTPHDWYNKLAAKPVDSANPADDGQPFAADQIYGAWGNQIVADWKATLAKLRQLPGVSEQQAAKADSLLTSQVTALQDYLASIEPDIVEYQSEQARLDEMKAQDARGELPFLDERIATKEAEIRAMPFPWLAAIASQERAFAEQLAGEISGAELTESAAVKQLGELFSPQGMLPLINITVTCVVLGSGLMMLLGLATPVAATAALLFLLSVISTQPPWDPDVTEQAGQFFGYQIAEAAGLLVTAVFGSGRWLGLDGMFNRLIFGSRNDFR